MRPNVFYIADEKAIREGRTTDIYFERTKKILKTKGKDKIKVSAEVTTGELSADKSWGVLCGIEEVAYLLEGLPIDVYSMPEGTVFNPTDYQGNRLPVMIIEGIYYDFCEFETPILGFICHESGVASRAAYIKQVAGDKPVVAFGIRRIHPALCPALDRAAYIGGMDGVSSLLGAETIGKEAIGTMPHALIIVFGDQVEAWKAFDEVIEPDVSRIILVDTYYDEKIESIMAAETLGDRLNAVRLDTPKSRRGNFEKIVKEVRWELDYRGYDHVQIFVSGGLNENTVKALSEAGADAFGVGTWVSGAPTLDFALDITEVEGKPKAKKGKLGGKKQVWRCPRCFTTIVLPSEEKTPPCHGCGCTTEAMLKPLIKKGKIVAELPKAENIRSYVLEQIKVLNET